MARRSLVSLALALAAGCQLAERRAISPPEELAYVAVLAPRAGTASPLLPRDAAVSLAGERAPGSSGERLLLGWTRESLQPIEALALEHQREGLEVQADCDRPRLPSPSYAADLHDLSVRAPDDVSRLSAAWLEGVVPPDVPSDLAVALRDPALVPDSGSCDLDRCRARLSSPGAGAFDVDLTDCDDAFAFARGHVDLDGFVCVEGPACRSVPAAPGAAGAIECAAGTSGQRRSCVFDLHGFRPLGEVTLRDLAPRSTPAPPFEGGRFNVGQVSGREIEAGALADLAVAGGRAIVVTGDRYRCPTADSSELIVLDSASLEPLTRTTSPRCLASLAASRSAGAAPLIAVAWTSTSAVSLIGLGPDGIANGLTGEIALAGLVPEVGMAHRVAGFGPLADSGLLAAVFGWVIEPTAPAVRGVAIVWLDAVTLEPRAHWTDDDTDPTGFAPTGGAGLLVPDDGNDRALWFDEPGSAPSETVVPEESLTLGPASWHPRSSRALLTVLRNVAAVHVVAEHERVSRVPFRADRAIPTAAHAWPPDPSLALVTLLRAGGDGEPESIAALFDPALSRFVPGAVAIGYGPVSRIEEGPGGTLLLLLPWAGQVARLRPAP